MAHRYSHLTGALRKVHKFHLQCCITVIILIAACKSLKNPFHGFIVPIEREKGHVAAVARKHTGKNERKADAAGRQENRKRRWNSEKGSRGGSTFMDHT
jgi:hypothetical protein